MIAAVRGELFESMNHREATKRARVKKQNKKPRNRSLVIDDKIKYVLPKECQEFFAKLENLAQLEMDDESFKNWFKKTSGMHTVQEWLENYDDHPYGWAALLMIHGTEEVGDRLRSKVENYAVYSAVLLAATVMLLVDPNSIPDTDGTAWELSALLGRVYLYCVAFSVTSHIACILLAMAFTNALNEAARDSDIIRMFAEGQGYIATTKVEKTFYGGLVFLLSALFCSIWKHHSLGDAVVVTVCSVSFLLYVYRPTKRRLFESSSIMAYWRLKKDSMKKRDPYDLTLPVERNKHKVSIGRRLDQMAVDLHDTHTGSSPNRSSSPAQATPARVDSSVSVVSCVSGVEDGSDGDKDSIIVTDLDDDAGISFQLG